MIGASAIAIAFFASDIRAWQFMYNSWMTSPDNSHGLLVPAFSAWLLWHRKDQLISSPATGSWSSIAVGIVLIGAGVAFRCFGIFTRHMTPEAGSLVPCLAGIVIICGGWNGIRWAWPSVLFLVFMIPLPPILGGMLSRGLQSVATLCSTYFLQTIGIPAISEGNVILLSDHSLGVAQACSGIRMLTSFFALAVGLSLVLNRPLWERLAIIASAPVIAIASNILRISATAIAYQYGNEKMAELIFHDLAGWLMMPIGLLLLWAELFVLSRVIEEEGNPQYASLAG